MTSGGEQKYERNTSVDTLSYIKKKESTIKNLSNFFREIFILLNTNLERLLKIMTEKFNKINSLWIHIISIKILHISFKNYS